MDDSTRAGILPRARAAKIDLPPPGTKRWVARRMAAVVTAVRSGANSLYEACRRYELSEEEYHAWEQGVGSYGVAAAPLPRHVKSHC